MFICLSDPASWLKRYKLIAVCLIFLDAGDGEPAVKKIKGGDMDEIKVIENNFFVLICLTAILFNVCNANN